MGKILFSLLFSFLFLLGTLIADVTVEEEIVYKENGAIVKITENENGMTVRRTDSSGNTTVTEYPHPLRGWKKKMKDGVIIKELDSCVKFFIDAAGNNAGNKKKVRANTIAAMQDLLSLDFDICIDGKKITFCEVNDRSKANLAIELDNTISGGKGAPDNPDDHGNYTNATIKIRPSDSNKNLMRHEILHAVFGMTHPDPKVPFSNTTHETAGNTELSYWDKQELKKRFACPEGAPVDEDCCNDDKDSKVMPRKKTQFFYIPNFTGQGANDLHIEYEGKKPESVEIKNKDNSNSVMTPKEDNDVNDLTGGTVSPGEGVVVGASTKADNVKIKQYYWTKGGSRISDVVTDRPAPIEERDDFSPAGLNEIYEFENDTGQDATDLHLFFEIRFLTETFIQQLVQHLKDLTKSEPTFKNVRIHIRRNKRGAITRVTVDFTGGEVKAGKKIILRFFSNSEVKVTKWGWSNGVNEDGTPRLIRVQETEPNLYDKDMGAFKYEDIYKFTYDKKKSNTRKKSVNDLHIYIKPIKNKEIDPERLKKAIVSLDQEDVVTGCKVEWDPKKKKLNVSGCEIPDGKPVIIKITYFGERIKILKWNWSLNGKKKGKTFYGPKHHKRMSPITKKQISYDVLDSPGAYDENAEIIKPGGYKITTETFRGIHAASLHTAWGRIDVNLPTDLVGGETISGSVYAVPYGEKKEERENNLGELNRHMVEIEEIGYKKTPAAQKRSSWMIPTAINALHLVFKNRLGIEVGRTEVPVYSVPLISPPTKFGLPEIGQAIEFLRIPGPFDGDFNSTRVRIGDFDAEILVETTRGLVILSPYQVIGQTTITLKEGNLEVSGVYRNIYIHTAVGKKLLKWGETTNFTVTVTGLDRLEDDVPFRLQNKSPEVISLENGNIQSRIIYAGDIAPGDIYTITRNLTGKKLGPFHLRTRIYPELKQFAERLGAITGRVYRQKLTSSQKREILIMQENKYITFTKKDLNIYKSSKHPSVWPGMKEWADELLDFLNSAKPGDQQWISHIYVSSILKALNGMEN